MTQQLYMNPYFRNSILNLQLSNVSKELQQQIKYLLAFKELFEQLDQRKERRSYFVETRKFVNSLERPEGGKISTYQQMDSCEFLRVTLQRISQQLQLIGEEDIVRKCFGMTMLNEMKHSELNYSHSIVNKEHLNVQMVQILDGENNNKITSLNDSLDCIIREEYFSGNNNIYCVDCNEEKDMIKHESFKTLPNTLIFQIKRFEEIITPYSIREKKLNDYFKFPEEINMFKYTTEYINSKENERNQFEQENYMYDLVGIVIHSGSTCGGHYYSFIKDQENQTNKWYRFNDSYVSDYDFKNNCKKDCFGDEKREDDYTPSCFYYNYCRNYSYSSGSSAYVLFYQKRQPTIGIPILNQYENNNNQNTINKKMFMESWKWISNEFKEIIETNEENKNLHQNQDQTQSNDVSEHSIIPKDNDDSMNIVD